MYSIVNLKTASNDNVGSLSFFEGSKDVSFEIKRVYFVYNVNVEVTRGFHAHKELDQLLWCPTGNIEILLDDGNRREFVRLDSPNKGLLLGPGVWHEMKWICEGSVLCVAASDYYDESDYIRDYSEFMSYVEKGYWSHAN